jgi:coenzyme F420-reducing hydrogenase beta subunit
MTEAGLLYEKIIKDDYCIGCGSCSGVENSPFRMHIDEFGNYKPYHNENLDNSNANVLKICPFSDSARNEDEISDMFFSEVKNKDRYIGRYLKCLAGYVNEGTFRMNGSSGGMGKWLGYTLLKENKIDYFIQVIPNKTKDPDLPLFSYSVFSDIDDVSAGSRSSYYPVSLAEVLKIIKEKEGRYAITGVPCFIKALRLLSVEYGIFRKRIKYTFGIVCGGMKSANHSKIIGWQLNVEPENLVEIDFRRKYSDKPANNKLYQVWSNKDNVERYKDAGQIFGTDWGSGYFKPNVCDYCDDVVAETSDISLGDAWLPQFENDPAGTNILVVRNSELLELLLRHNISGNITLTDLTSDDVVKSQEGGFRQRREALSYRIGKKEKSKNWCPKKRVAANEFYITRKRKRIYSLREKIAQQSHLSAYKAISNNDLNIFFTEMKPLARKYRNANYGSLPVRALRKLKRKLLSYTK